MARDEFADFYRRYHRRIRGYVRSLGSDVDPDDATQLTVLRLWTIWDRIDHSRPLEALAFKVARDAVADARRDQRRIDRILPLYQDPRTPADATVERVVTRDDHAAVREAIGALSEADRDMLVLRYWHDLSSEDIATLRGTTVAAVHQRASRARRRCREYLAALDRGLGAVVAAVLVAIRWVRRQISAPSVSAAVALAVVGATVTGAGAAGVPYHGSPGMSAESTTSKQEPTPTTTTLRPTLTPDVGVGEESVTTPEYDAPSQPPATTPPRDVSPLSRPPTSAPPDSEEPEAPGSIEVDTPLGRVTIGNSPAPAPSVSCGDRLLGVCERN